MLLEYTQPDNLVTQADRRRAGQDLRRLVPRSQHARWHASEQRHDPLDVLADATRHCISTLLPVRHGRMKQSPLRFMCGSAAVMAADLATTPTSGIWVQSCGDCHHANFGIYAALDGPAIFDITDFDETLPAPFEWDLKRLATSFTVDAQCRQLPERTARHLARSVAAAYREHMMHLMRLDPQRIWRSRIDVLDVMQAIDDVRLRQRQLKRMRLAADADRRGYSNLLERRRSGWRIRSEPTPTTPIARAQDDTMELVARTAFDAYKLSQPEERGVLLDRYQLTDVAFKMVGVGNIGSFCAIGLFVDGDGGQLLLQLKEAQRSVLAPFAAPSAYANHGQRVVTGQRIMQGEPDSFLGYTQEHGSDQYCYVRQLKDERLAAVREEIADEALPCYAMLCGKTLARAHARSGDPARIAGYMGSGEVFDIAVGEFAMAYSTQVQRDWQLFVDAIKSGAIEARCA